MYGAIHSCKSFVSKSFRAIPRDRMVLMLFVIATMLVLGFTINLEYPFEQDQGSKAAKILYQVHNNTILDPLSGPGFYRDHLFSFYYIVSSLFYKLFGGNIYAFMNSMSMFMGVIFFTSLLILLKRAFHIPYLYSWVVFISMPLLIITFTYGNEVAFSFAFFTLSLSFLTLRKIWRLFPAVIFLIFSIFSRADAILLVPFWFAFLLLFNSNRNHRKLIIKELILSILLVFCFAVVYFLVFIHHLPDIGSVSFKMHTNIKLLLAYFIYPFCPSILFLGALGYAFIARTDKRMLVLILLLLPALFYFRNLSSPKYIIWFSLFIGIPSAALLVKVGAKYKAIALSLIGIWWFVSITPWGISGTRAGAYWSLPTADGYMPTGSYISFYQNIHNGFYQIKYKDEIETLDKAVDYIINTNDNYMLSGFFNVHFLRQICVEKNILNRIEILFKSQSIIDNVKPTLVIRRGYLRTEWYNEETRSAILRYLKNGQLRAITDEKSPFPSVIEIGNHISLGTNVSYSKTMEQGSDRTSLPA